MEPRRCGSQDASDGAPADACHKQDKLSDHEQTCGAAAAAGRAQQPPQQHSQQQQQQRHAPHQTALQQPPRISPLTLWFSQPWEQLYSAWWNERASSIDKQAAWVYLWMVGVGSCLYCLIIAFLPAVRPAHVDQCTALILASWLGPSMHLLLMARLPHATYVRHRTAAIVALRCFYVAATAANGFAQCGMAPLQTSGVGVLAAGLPSSSSSSSAAAAAAAPSAPPATMCPLESPLSAVLWRSGTIGLIWWGAAFPLPFSLQLLVQGASVVVFARTLSPFVCGTMANVRWGAGALAAVEAAGQGAAAALAGAVGAARVAEAAAGRAAAAAAASASGVPLGGSGASCVQCLAFLQLVLGLVAPAAVLYCFEARRRIAWWCRQAQQQQQPRMQAGRVRAVAATAGAVSGAADAAAEAEDGAGSDGSSGSRRSRGGGSSSSSVRSAAAGLSSARALARAAASPAAAAATAGEAPLWGLAEEDDDDGGGMLGGTGHPQLQAAGPATPSTVHGAGYVLLVVVGLAWLLLEASLAPAQAAA